MRQKKAITAEIQLQRFKTDTKKQKKDNGKILDEFYATTKYNRTYAARF